MYPSLPLQHSHGGVRHRARPEPAPRQGFCRPRRCATSSPTPWPDSAPRGRPRCCASSPAKTSPIASILTAGLRKAGKSPAGDRKGRGGRRRKGGGRDAPQVQTAGRSIANIAPLLGLLGTVTGMISAFMTVAAREEALGRTETAGGRHLPGPDHDRRGSHHRHPVPRVLLLLRRSRRPAGVGDRRNRHGTD